MEKEYNEQQRENKALQKQKKTEKKIDSVVRKEQKKEMDGIKKEEKAEDKKTEKKKPVQKIKKDEAVVNGTSLPISTKDSVAICKFIKRKTIQKAIADLEEVEKLKKAIPMTGEIPHRKGKGMMSGRYMTKPVGYFIRMLKGLLANSNMNGMEEPVIVEAVPNRASRPYGRFGRVKRKRTHIHIKAVEKNKLKVKKK